MQNFLFGQVSKGQGASCLLATGFICYSNGSKLTYIYVFARFIKIMYPIGLNLE